MKVIARTLTLLASLGMLSLGLPSTVSAAPTPPSSINATSTRGSAAMYVKWSSVAGATGYQAQLSIGNVPVKTSPTIASNQLEYTFVGLEYNIPYTVKVRSTDGAWSSFGDAVENPVIPAAAKPSTPEPPTVSVSDDFKVKASWSPPSSSGGSPIASYSVQLLKGTEAAGEPIVVKGLEVELQTKDKTNQYSVVVSAVNEANVSSEASEPSSPVVAEKKATATVVLPSPPSNNPSSGGGSNNPSSGGGSNNPSSGGGSNNPSITTPEVDQTTRIVSPAPVIPSFTKVIKRKATTTSKTLMSLSKLSTPKGSKTTFSIATSSRKVCQLKGTSVKNLKAGTCSVKVTVTTKSGKKSSRTVKLIAR